MADVFISYKREDRAIAEQLAHEIKASGFTAFFDVEIPVGDMWDSRIESELNAAAVVVVLWSQSAADSRWVKLEARRALERGVLLPALIGDCRVPLEFSDIQTADLRAFAPETLAALFAQIESYCGPRTSFIMPPSVEDCQVEDVSPRTSALVRAIERKLQELTSELIGLCNDLLARPIDDASYLQSVLMDRIDDLYEYYAFAYGDVENSDFEWLLDRALFVDTLLQENAPKPIIGIAVRRFAERLIEATSQTEDSTVSLEDIRVDTRLAMERRSRWFAVKYGMFEGVGHNETDSQTQN